jgi:transcriptional regulator with XRE-family HTH domain
MRKPAFDRKGFGKALRRRRSPLLMSLREAARRTETPLATLHRAEHGEVVGIEHLARLARYFGLDLMEWVR